MKNKTKAYLGLALLIFISLYGIYTGSKKQKLLQESGKYTIATIEKLKIGSKGIIVFINYFYERKKIKIDVMTDYENKVKLFLGKRIFIKFIPDNSIHFVGLDFDCIVPDSIKSAPSTGWTKQWMKKHFPDCVDL